MLALAALLSLALAAAAADLRGQIATHAITLPAALKPGGDNWRVWGSKPLTTRLYLSPTADGYLVGWSDAAGAGHVTAVSSQYTITKTLDFAGVEVRGLAGHSDGSFGVLLWSQTGKSIAVRKVSSSGAKLWETKLVNSDGAVPDDFGIGESRLTYGTAGGKGRYGAYYHVHSTTGHEGDALKWVDEATGAATNEWDWGCSHSMSVLLGFSSADSLFAPVCVTDCYPGTGSGDFSAVSQGGIFSWNDESKRIYTLDGGCDGSVAGELGEMVAAPTTGFKMVPTADGYLVGWSDAAGAGHVTAVSSQYTITKTLDFAGVEVRGLAGHSDGSFGVLLWSQTGKSIAVRKVSSSGAKLWETKLVNSDGAVPDDFGIGESRLTYGTAGGKGRYGAYYHVHSTTGHEGDALKWVDEATGAATNEWDWGCSHSMSVLLGFSSADSLFAPVCVTDCYPGTGSGDFSAVSQGGIFSWNDESKRIYTLDGGCDGSVAGELGEMVAAPTTGFKMVFNGHRNKAGLGQNSYKEDSMNQDIGFVSIGSDGSLSGSVKWLTSTSENEADSGIARYGGITQELYLAGWKSGSKYMLAEVDGSGAFQTKPVDVTDLVQWGARDDPFKTAADGSIVWVYSPAQASDIVIARVTNIPLDSISASGAGYTLSSNPSAPVRVYDASVSAAAGDVDGDHVGDIVTAGHGAIHVVLGPLSQRTRVATSPGHRIDAPQCDGGAGSVAVASAGDINSDGLNDFIAVCGGGRAYVVLGRAMGTAWPRDTSSVGNATRSFSLAQAGAWAAGVGDINGDKCGDIAVARADGLVAVLFGRRGAAWPDVVDVSVAPSRFPFGGFVVRDAERMSSAGDVNGDGIDDLVVGNAQLSPGGRYRAGSAFIVFGRASWAETLDLRTDNGVIMIELDLAQYQGTGYILLSQSTAPQVGASVHGVGDINNDGHADFAVGAPGAGLVFIKLGAIGPVPPESSIETGSVVLESNEAWDMFGWSVSSGGDDSATMGFAKLDLDTFDATNLIPISVQQALIYKAKAAERKKTGKTTDVSIPKKFVDLKDFVFATTRPPDVYASRQLFDKIVTYKDPGHKPEYFIEVTKLRERIPSIKIDKLMDRTSDIAIHIDETIAEGILDDLGHSSDRFDKKKFVTKATTMGIRDSGSSDKFKKPQEQIKQSRWGEFKIVEGKVQTFLTFEDRERCRKDKLCFVCRSPNHNKEDCPNVKGKAPTASSTTEIPQPSRYSPSSKTQQVEVKPSNDPANPLEQIRESDMVEFLRKKGYKVNYANIAVDHIASPTVVQNQAKDDTENPFGDVPTFDNVAMIDLSLFEKIYEPSEATCGRRIILQPIVSTGSHAGQNVNAQLDSGADRMMINVKYVKKLQWDDHHFICKFENPPIFEYNHAWNKLVKEQEDPIELPVPTLAPTFQEGQLPPVNIGPLISDNPVYLQRTQELLLSRAAVFRPLDAMPVDYPKKFHIELKPGAIVRGREVPHLSKEDIDFISGETRNWDRVGVFLPITSFEEAPIAPPPPAMPVVVIRNEERRWCGNYIPLNECTVKKKMGSLKVWDVVQHCAGNKWLSKWDMKRGYFQFAEAISYLIQPFKEFKNYIDDCIQATNGFETWYESAEKFLDMCITKNIKLNAPKCFIESPFEFLFMDHIGKLTESNNKHYILTVIDRFSLWTWLVATESTDAEEVMDALWKYVFSSKSFPRTIGTDGAGAFKSEEFSSMLKGLDINHHISAPHHPQGHGVVEVRNKQVVDIVRAVVKDDKDWDVSLPAISLTINCVVSRLLGTSPFRVIHNFEPRLPLNIAVGGQQANKDIEESDDQYEFAQRNVVKAAELFPVVQELQKRIEDEHRTRYIASAKGKTSYQPGDYVILWSKRDEKLDLAWSGPFVVIGTHRDSNVIYEIESLVDHVRSTAHVDRLHFFYPGDMTLEQLSKEACNRGEFLIEKVYKHRRENGKLYFRIKYVGFPDVPDDHPDAWNVYENVRWCAPIKEYMNIHKITKPKLFKRG
eukprot:m51a1_g9322 hypothetical protein (1998) ;mRNA; f:142560-155187